MAEVIGEFQYRCGEWFESDFYWQQHGCTFSFQWIAGEWAEPT